MSQFFKAVYFADNEKSAGQNILTLAFGNKDSDLYEKLKPLSSQEIRELLGYSSYLDLQNDANLEGLPLNTYCLWKIRKKLNYQHKDKDSSKPLSFFLNPIHATFKGGEKDPLQRWYPYLEGYSPQFVQTILAEYSPNAKVVYDPFSGVGTTPLVAADLNLEGLYSEINPLLQFLTEVKINARNLDPKKRKVVIQNLKEIQQNLESHLRDNPPDTKLSEAYKLTFNKSQFFDETTYQKVLKARTLIDTIACYSPLSSNLLTVAILSSLIPSSLLQRAGDLRFKNKEELIKKKVDFVDSVKQNLETIISDLQIVTPLPKKPTFVTEDARNIDKLNYLGIDTVITSPPYLNGTNYFRNTKVELWFLRSLKTNEDLAFFRRKSVTAGINDVSFKKLSTLVPNIVKNIVSELERNAYDRRIPKMVGDYFQDMAIIFEANRRHLKNSSLIAIDIGDSLYGNIHVPTDKLLVDVLESRGYKFKKDIELRKRTSRNGSILKQTLLILESASPKFSQQFSAYPSWYKKWSDFKINLPHHNQPFAKRNWGHPLHSLCSYQGKMKPSLAYHLVKTFADKGDTILDPFAGVGTIPFEAALNGIKSYGFDISPTAIVISEAKIKKPVAKDCNSLIDRLENYLKNKDITEIEKETASSFGFNSKLKDYFEPRTLKEILLARGFFIKNPPKDQSEALVVSSLLHILHGNRPYALSRRSHGITPFSPTGNFEYKSLISHLKDKVHRSLEVSYPEQFVEGKVFFQDATLWWPQEVDNLDAIITSPPFFDSTRFHLANWMRLWFCGWNHQDFKTKPLYFLDERQKQSFEVYEPVLRQGRERLKKDGVFIFHLGKSKKCDMAQEIAKIAKKWFKIEDIYSENVQHTESHGIRDKGTVIEHQFLILT